MELTAKILENLAAFSKKVALVEEAQKKALEAVAIRLRDDAVTYVEAGHPDHPEVQSGRLKSSLKYQMTDASHAVVGSDADYAPYVEFGHAQEPGRFVPALGKRLVASSVKPYPFLRPAIDDVMNGDGISVFTKVFKTQLKL